MSPDTRLSHSSCVNNFLLKGQLLTIFRVKHLYGKINCEFHPGARAGGGGGQICKIKMSNFQKSSSLYSHTCKEKTYFMVMMSWNPLPKLWNQCLRVRGLSPRVGPIEPNGENVLNFRKSYSFWVLTHTQTHTHLYINCKLFFYFPL